jgi:hypothetical protein
MSERFWSEDPSVLFAPGAWARFVPTKDMATGEALNSVVRFAVYFSVILFLMTGVGGYILAIPAVMVATLVLFRIFPNGKVLETFVNQAVATASGTYTMPTADNPFMNPMLTEITDSPDRPDAAPIHRADVKAEVYKAFQKTSDMYMDTTDLFDQSQAMRTFHTLQSGTIPNDQDGFLKFLAKGQDDPDYSSAPLARNGKRLSEGYVEAKGSMRDLASTTRKPTGTSPRGAPATAAAE